MPTRLLSFSSRGRRARAGLPGLFLALACLALGMPGFAAAARAAAEPPSHLLTKAPALPLSIDPAVQFRKNKLFLMESPALSGALRPSDEPSLAFERRRLLYGALTGSDIRNRFGNYFTIFWRTQRRANLTLRLEYRQQKLGSYLQAKEVEYPDAKGSFTTHFQVTGDDYFEQGRVVQSRAVLIEDHRVIVGLTQSYLWR